MSSTISDRSGLAVSSQQAGKALRSIQCLRAVAALLVVLFHVAPAVTIGAGGVDLFFVISGFIMGAIAIREAPLNFINNRLIRVLPLYWLVTTLYLVCSYVPALSKSAYVSGTYFLQSLLFIPYFDPLGRVAPILVAGWTLNFEIFFYLVFACALPTRAPRISAISAILLLVTAGLVAQPLSAALQTWTAPIMLEFAFGLALSGFYTRLDARAGAWLFAIGVLGFASAQWFGVGGDGLGFARVLLWGLPAFAIVMSAVAFENAGLWPTSLRPLEIIGGASYSLYLLHGIVASVVYKLSFQSMFSGFAIMAASILVALISFYYFESPITKYLRGLTPRSPTPLRV